METVSIEFNEEIYKIIDKITTRQGISIETFIEAVTLQEVKKLIPEAYDHSAKQLPAKKMISIALKQSMVKQYNESRLR